jgi:hypothetical protein
MKLLVNSKKVFFKKQLFGWFYFWQFVIRKSCYKMLIVYTQATMRRKATIYALLGSEKIERPRKGGSVVRYAWSSALVSVENGHGSAST